MRERDRKLDPAKLDRGTRRTVESLGKALKGAPRGASGSTSSEEAAAAAGRLTVWADETAKKQKRRGTAAPSHELLGVSEREYRRMAKKRPLFYWGTPNEKDVLAAAKVYKQHR